MEKKISESLERLSKIEDKLSDPEVFNNSKIYRELTQEYSYLLNIKNTVDEIATLTKTLEENREFYDLEQDEEMRTLLKEEIQQFEIRINSLNIKLENLLVPPDPDDDRSIILELRAGTGGDEAALFVGNCVRMYHLYAEDKGWHYESLGCAPSELGGYKEYIMVISGTKTKRCLQYEAGTHRVQRVPDTESQGRVHTSAITIAVMLEPTKEEEFKIEEKDLRIDTYRASGSGGQHVNTTDSAVRITHLPTGMVAYCQDERSQHKNKDKALRLLIAKLADAKKQQRLDEESSLRASQVGSGDRSERIRTYNFPQNRVTDHRINLTLYNLDRVMEGELDMLTIPLIKYYYHQRLLS
ncbi:MAG: peptide chain release factor 1 [Chlamydiales bacterium]